MNRTSWPIVITAVVIYLAVQVYRHGPSNTIDYQGQSFKMSKWYWSYEDYKDDVNNLDPKELPRIEQAMTEARFPAAFATEREYIHAVFKLRFPGYGLGGIGTTPETDDGSRLYVESVEIPQRDKDRYLVVREAGGSLKTLDDFIASTASNSIAQVKLQRTNILYFNRQGTVVREKDLPVK
jgi:hypothetical protein